MMTTGENKERTAAEIFREAFLRKMEKAPRYSLRAFARDLGVSPSFVSLAVRGKKRLSVERAVQVSQFLGMKGDEMERFVRAVAGEMLRRRPDGAILSQVLGGEGVSQRRNISPSSAVPIDIDRFRALSEWYYSALLELTTCEGFKSDPKWVAEQLGISPLQVLEAVDRLRRLGLLEVDEKKGWRKTHQHLVVPAEKSHMPVRQYHRQMMEKAIDTLSSASDKDFQKRSISGATLAINPRHLREANRRIEKFRSEIIDLVTKGACREVYQLNIQLFSLLKSKDKGRSTS